MERSKKKRREWGKKWESNLAGFVGVDIGELNVARPGLLGGHVVEEGGAGAHVHHHVPAEVVGEKVGRAVHVLSPKREMRVSLILA